MLVVGGGWLGLKCHSPIFYPTCTFGQAVPVISAGGVAPLVRVRALLVSDTRSDAEETEN